MPSRSPVAASAFALVVAASSHAVAQPEPSPDPDAGETIEVTGETTRIPPPKRGASDFVLPRERLDAAPHRDAGEMLAVAPGVYVGRGEGDAVAHSIFLRGFDAEHGQDIELTVAGIPINQRSHLHGQGYADLGFIIPEVVRSIRVTEGVYDPRQGDFATAGTIAFDLGVEHRGLLARLTAGSFGERRALVTWAPEGTADDTFAAVALRRTNGFGANRGGAAAQAIAQRELALGDTRAIVHAAFAGARANTAGVLRLDDIAAGRVGYYDSYDLPTATAQSALGTRAQLGVDLVTSRDDGTRTELAAYAGFVGFRLRSNQTGFLETSQVNPEFHGRGDLVEQANADWMLGVRASHRFVQHEWRCIRGQLEVGAAGQLDAVDQAQHLIRAPQNETWDDRVDATIRAADVGAWIDGQLWLGERWRLRGGGRADALFFDVDDRLGNFIPANRPENYLVGYRRTALGFAAGPRATLEWEPRRDLLVLASYGEGFRSPQARQLEEGETAPYAKVRSGEVGVQLGSDLGAFHVGAAAYWTTLSLDLAYDPGTSSLERIGPSTRLGVTLDAVARPAPWLFAALAVNVVRATLDAPPPATAEVPDPPYEPGQRLPYVPPVVVRADIAAHHRIGALAGHPVSLGGGLGVQYLAPRPLPFGERGETVLTIDGSIDVHWRDLELGVQAFNLLDRRYPALELAYVSNWDPDGIPSRIPARHIAAAPPLTILVSLGVHL
jgi:iron complex outermembrane receptor protein